MRMLVVIPFLLVLVGCAQTAERTVGNSNSAFNVEKCFTDDDGYTVKRFYDNGRFHYYVTPKGSVNTTQNQGKTRYVERIDTE